MAIRPRGSSWYVYYIDPNTGKRVDKRAGKYKRDAEKLDAEIKLGKFSGTFHTPTKLKLREVADEWLTIKRKELRPITIKNYTSTLNVLLKEIGAKPLAAVRQKDIEKALSYTKGNLTYNTRLRHIKALFHWSIDQGYINESPIKRMKARKADRKEVRILTPQEVRTVLDSLPEPGRRIILMAYLTGMRVGEIFRLAWKDIDFESREIVVRGETKTKSSKRRIAIAESLLTELESWDRTSKYVIPGKQKRQMQYNTFHYCYWKPYIDNLGMDITPHSFRHTFISTLIRSGANLKLVQELAGHSSFKMTMDVYAHVISSDSHDAIGRLNEAFSETLYGRNVPNETILPGK